MSLSFERSAATDAVIRVLRAVNGDITYADIATRAKLPLTVTKTALHSARRILRREKILFGTEIGIGLKRLGDTEKVQLSQTHRHRLGKASGRALKDLTTIENFEALSNVDQLQVTTNRTIFELIRTHTRSS